MRAAITMVVLVCGVLLSAGIHHGTGDVPTTQTRASALDSARLSIIAVRRQLSISGTTSSADHERALRQLAADMLPDRELITEFDAGVLLHPGWDATSNRLLYAVAAMDSADAYMDSESVSIRGVSSDAATFASRIEFLREQLPRETELDVDVIFVRSTVSLDELCQKAFDDMPLGPVSFAQSSVEISPASLATLDRITDFAHDCQNVTIAITGHTDSSGNESWNRQLSLARARSVADHIAGNGIDPKRLVVAGLGSSVPIADNSTAQGRELNRRIEFELR
jgi:OOP family OmpA-OmpF porin